MEQEKLMYATYHHRYNPSFNKLVISKMRNAILSSGPLGIYLIMDVKSLIKVMYICLANSEKIIEKENVCRGCFK